MGDFGYVFGYMLVFALCCGVIIGYEIGRWLK